MKLISTENHYAYNSKCTVEHEGFRYSRIGYPLSDGSNCIIWSILFCPDPTEIKALLEGSLEKMYASMIRDMKIENILE